MKWLVGGRKSGIAGLRDKVSANRLGPYTLKCKQTGGGEAERRNGSGEGVVDLYRKETIVNNNKTMILR